MNYIDDLLKSLEHYIKPQGLKILTVIGLLSVTSRSFKLLRHLASTLRIGHRHLLDRYGHNSWAVITGGASVPGSSFALELAERGFNVLLIDSDTSLLGKVSLKISEKCPSVGVRTLEANFAKCLEANFWEDLFERIDNIDISVLVNCAGTSQPVGMFHWAPEDQIKDSIIQNIFPVTIMSRRIIPQMLRRTHKSAVINMSSIAGVYPTLMLGMFSGTKAYVNALSSVIDQEVGDKVDVLTVNPWILSNVANRKSIFRGFNVTPEDLAKSSMKRLGIREHIAGSHRQGFMGGLYRNGWLRNTLQKRLYQNEQNVEISNRENII